MNGSNDDDLQELAGKPFEGGDDAGAGEDLVLYRQLFQTLNEEAKRDQPSPGFQAAVGDRLRAIRDRRNARRFIFTLTLVTVICVALSCFFLVIIDHTYSTAYSQGLFRFKWIALFSLAGLIAIQLADYQWVKGKRKFGLQPPL